ncbi:glycerophosphodiester phosphodiesterase family protein [Hydrogenophaga sp. 5NK40-0174]|uniref:glycerophosphodiester phosphodiesterase family protein n=1 Tax=Hydrogenophaga sp. 5NK40-0174 TaxID=3127649 RepID=UPI0031060EBA
MLSRIHLGAALLIAFGTFAHTSASMAAPDHGHHGGKFKDWFSERPRSIQVGARPFFLANDMEESALKKQMQQCTKRPAFTSRDFSIGHRGAPMQFPEHTMESYTAAARMGAGIVECDVTFTKDKALVCRHAQNDLHTTTNILLTPLAAKCTKAFTPAVLDTDGKVTQPASAECRTSDITLAEFKSLRGKMDAFNPAAQTVEDYVAGTANWRTDIYSGPTSGTLMTHAESIALFKKLGVKMTPELKSPSVDMPFEGFTQQAYAQKMIDEYKSAGVPARRVFAQSFNKDDVLYWLNHAPAFGRQAVYLDDAETPADLPGAAELAEYKADGINIVAPPLWALIAADGNGQLVPSPYAQQARSAGLDIITWTLERSGILADGNNGWYYQTFDSAIGREGDQFRVLDVLAKDVGVLGVFSDWPATTTFYANCANLR